MRKSKTRLLLPEMALLLGPSSNNTADSAATATATSSTIEPDNAEIGFHSMPLSLYSSSSSSSSKTSLQQKQFHHNHNHNYQNQNRKLTSCDLNSGFGLDSNLFTAISYKRCDAADSVQIVDSGNGDEDNANDKDCLIETVPVRLSNISFGDNCGSNDQRSKSFAECCMTATTSGSNHLATRSSLLPFSPTTTTAQSTKSFCFSPISLIAWMFLLALVPSHFTAYQSNFFVSSQPHQNQHSSSSSSSSSSSFSSQFSPILDHDFRPMANPHQQMTPASVSSHPLPVTVSHHSSVNPNSSQTTILSAGTANFHIYDFPDDQQQSESHFMPEFHSQRLRSVSTPPSSSSPGRSHHQSSDSHANSPVDSVSESPSHDVPYALEEADPNPDVALAKAIADKLPPHKNPFFQNNSNNISITSTNDANHHSHPHPHHHHQQQSPLQPIGSGSHSNFQNLGPGVKSYDPYFADAQLSVSDPMMENEPAGSSPVLMNYMHLNSKQSSPPTSDSAMFDESFFQGSPYSHLTSHFRPEEEMAGASADGLTSHPAELDQMYQEMADSMFVPKRPVAQDMLFAKQHNHYTPYKGSTINVYAKYLTRGDSDYQQCSKSYSSPRRKYSKGDIDSAVRNAAKVVNWYQDTVTKNAMETKRRTPYIKDGVLDSKLFEYASQYLKKKKCMNKMDVVMMMPKFDIGQAVSHYEMQACMKGPKIVCDPKSRYRTIDGSCNNLKLKTVGQSFTCHRRLLPPDYEDGVSGPRIAHDGFKLPNARDISSLLLPDINVQDHKLTSMTMSFGQFVIHDITRTLPFSNDIQCCPTKGAVHPECFGIEINRREDFLTKTYNQTCLNFVRSTVCNPCSLGPREQQNQATHTFDMSHMYGLRLNDSIPLRTLQGGKLRSSFTSSYPKEELPPKMVKEDPQCNVRPVPPRFKCFESSDGIRASQHPALQALHVAFHRRHNQHCDGLARVNPHWDDERTYQEARRITIAEEVRIIYGEYLPAIFGKKLTHHFRLSLNYKGYTRYDPKLNPASIQEFILASGRFGHTQINDQFRVMFEDKKMSYSYSLRDNFFETTIVSLGHSGGILKGQTMDSTEAPDPYFVDDIKNFLYHLRTEKFGRDLPAFNIQRGRDHGIPGYVYYLDFCFGFKVKSWKDLATFIPKKQLKKIQIFYKHWKDVDLFVGGVSERLISGAAFGPTFACINGIQFYNWKFGDRYYFEHGHQAGSFSPAQLDNIRRLTTLSSLICKTFTEIKQLPSNAFIKPSPHHNPIRYCHTYPELNYGLWAERKGYGGGYGKMGYYPKMKPMMPKKYKPKSVTKGYSKYPHKYHHNHHHHHHNHPKPYYHKDLYNEEYEPQQQQHKLHPQTGSQHAHHNHVHQDHGSHAHQHNHQNHKDHDHHYASKSSQPFVQHHISDIPSDNSYSSNYFHQYHKSDPSLFPVDPFSMAASEDSLQRKMPMPIPIPTNDEEGVNKNGEDGSQPQHSQQLQQQQYVAPPPPPQSGGQGAHSVSNNVETVSESASVKK